MKDSKHKQNSSSQTARGLSNTMLPDLLCLPLLLLNQRVHVHDNLHLLCKHGVSLLQYFYSKRSRKMAQLQLKKKKKKKMLHPHLRNLNERIRPLEPHQRNRAMYFWLTN